VIGPRTQQINSVGTSEHHPSARVIPFTRHGDREQTARTTMSQDRSFGPIASTVHPLSDSPSETERTVPTDRLCASCDRALNDRRPQARHCSDRCRMKARRQSKAVRRERLLLQIEAAVAALREDLQ